MIWSYFAVRSINVIKVEASADIPVIRHYLYNVYVHIPYVPKYSTHLFPTPKGKGGGAPGFGVTSPTIDRTRHWNGFFRANIWVVCLVAYRLFP